MTTMSDLRNELIQVAAVAVAMVSLLDSYSTGLAFDNADDAKWDGGFQRIVTDITDERIRQEAMWGVRHSFEEDGDVFFWLSILGEEVGEAHTEALEAKASETNWSGWPERSKHE